jgi:hypothetical protein
MSSKSSSSNLVIPEDKKLYYRANGESNLPVWRLFLIFRLKNEFGADASEMIERLAVPARLTTPYAFPVVAAPAAVLSPLEERLTTKRYETEMATYIEAQLAWDRSKAFITTAIINCMSESSIARINSVYETEYTAAYTANNPLEIFNIVVMAHTFSGQTSGAEDRRHMYMEFYSFGYEPPETLYAFRKRFDLIAMAIPDHNRTAAMLAQAIYSGLARYP